MDPWVQAIVLVSVAFIPPLIYVLWVRNLERHEREPWGQVAKAFVWGATGSVVLAIILSLLIMAAVEPVYAGLALVVPFTALTATLVAPVAEEPAKALGLRWVKDPKPEPEDGLVYGAAAGLGFASTENLLYALDPLLEGAYSEFLVVAAIRSVAAAFLHASATAIVGFGFLATRSFWRGLPYLGLAILLHGTYNGLLSSGAILSYYVEDALLLTLLGFFVAMGLAIVTFGIVRRHVRSLDRGTELPPF